MSHALKICPQDVEFIIACSGATAEVKALARSFADSDPRITVLECAAYPAAVARAAAGRRLVLEHLSPHQVRRQFDAALCWKAAPDDAATLTGGLPIAHVPLFSVIIPTFNWSSALALSLRSVLAQSHADFEVLVVGDGCTDDSEAVVRGLGDPRLRWFNLPDNIGSQWAGNNLGLAESRGEYIAYLGHDDLWHPDHLQTAADLIATHRPAAIAAGVVLHGPPGSGVRAVSGVFVGGHHAPTQMIVPSGLLHRRDIIGTMGPWKDHRMLVEPVDIEFVLRLARTVGDITSTKRFTVFKWPSAWRRDSYRTRDVAPQAAALAALAGDAPTRERFMAAELWAVVQAAADGRVFPTAILQENFTGPAGARTKSLLAARGLVPTAPTVRLGSLRSPLRIGPPFSALPFEWYAVEQSTNGPFAWSGPACVSGIDLPVYLDGPAEVVIAGTGTFIPNNWASIAISVAGRDVPLHRESDGPFLLLRGRLLPSDQPDPSRPVVITLSVPGVARPFDRRLGGDRRWLGAAISFVELRVEGHGTGG